MIEAPPNIPPEQHAAPTVPQPNRLKGFAVPVFIIVAVGIGGGVWWYFQPEFNAPAEKSSAVSATTTIQDTNISAPVSAVQIEQERKEVLRSAIITFSNIIPSRTRLGITPADLYSLVEHERGVSVSDVQYEDGNTGQYIEFLLLGTVSDAVKRFGSQLRKLGWEILNGAYGEVFGFIDAEREGRRVRVTYTYKDSETSVIVIQSIVPQAYTH